MAATAPAWGLREGGRKGWLPHPSPRRYRTGGQRGEDWGHSGCHLSRHDHCLQKAQVHTQQGPRRPRPQVTLGEGSWLPSPASDKGRDDKCQLPGWGPSSIGSQFGIRFSRTALLFDACDAPEDKGGEGLLLALRAC